MGQRSTELLPRISQDPVTSGMVMVDDLGHVFHTDARVPDSTKNRPIRDKGFETPVPTAGRAEGTPVIHLEMSELAGPAGVPDKQVSHR